MVTENVGMTRCYKEKERELSISSCNTEEYCNSECRPTSSKRKGHLQEAIIEMDVGQQVELDKDDKRLKNGGGVEPPK